MTPVAAEAAHDAWRREINRRRRVAHARLEVAVRSGEHVQPVAGDYTTRSTTRTATSRRDDRTHVGELCQTSVLAQMFERPRARLV